MAKPLDPSALIPAGFVVDGVVIEADRWVVRAHGAAHSTTVMVRFPAYRITWNGAPIALLDHTG